MRAIGLPSLLLAAALNPGSALTGGDSSGVAPLAAPKPLESSYYTASALLEREPPSKTFLAGNMMWSCVQRECQGEAGERFDGCKMIRACLDLRRAVGPRNSVLAYSAEGHPLEATRLQLCNHPDAASAQSLIPQGQLPPDPNCVAGGAPRLR